MKNLCLFVYLLFLSGSLFSQDRFQLSRVKIHASHADLKKIKSAGVEFDHGYYDQVNSTFENEFESKQIEIIRNLGFKVEIIVQDVFAYTDSLNRTEDPYKYSEDPVKASKDFQTLRLNFTTTQNFESSIPTPTTFAFGSMGGFYNLTELEAQFDNMVSSYPGLVTKTSIGNTLQGRPIYVVKISDNAATDEAEAEMLYTGMHHSREGMSMMNLIFYMRFLLENYSSNPAVKAVIDNRELYFVPVVNVDGFNYNTTAANWNATPTPRRMRRKNMRETTTNGIAADGSGGDGVDINRNFPTYWGTAYSNGNTASSATTNADSYRGPSAASEPETVVMQNFVNSRQFKIALNYHCYGNWWIRPQGPDPAVYPGVNLSTTAVSTYNSIAALLTKYNCYVYGTPNQTVYDVNGYSDDWLFSDPSHAPVYAFSPEIGNSGDGFWCPQSKIIPYGKEQIFANLQAAYTTGGYAELQDTSDVALNSLTGFFGFSVTRKGLVDSPVKVSVIPISNLASNGASVVIASIPAFGGTASNVISYSLPATLSAGSVVRFAWEWQVDGIILRDTITKIYKPLVLFSDDMETAGNYATKWVNSGSGSAWAYAAGNGLNGSAGLTESPGGDYANSADHVTRLATPLDLSSTVQVQLSYMLKYASENGQDRLQVEVSTTGVTGTYSPISTDHTIKESRGSLGNFPALTGSTDGWVRELIDLTPYAGNSNVGLRFRFLSNASNGAAYSASGFQIDNFKVVKSNAVVLPVSFEDIIALRVNESVLIKWKATVRSSDFVHYKVQRSANGVDFETVGTITNAVVLDFTDLLPQRGNNYYRIQVMHTDNEIRLSKTVRVVFEGKISITTYPNPFAESLNIEVESQENSHGLVEMTTADGKVVYSSRIVLRRGKNLYKVNTLRFKNQLYVITLKDDKGITLNVSKLMRISR